MRSASTFTLWPARSGTGITARARLTTSGLGKRARPDGRGGRVFRQTRRFVRCALLHICPSHGYEMGSSARAGAMSVERPRHDVALRRRCAVFLLACAATLACARGDDGHAPRAVAAPTPVVPVAPAPDPTALADTPKAIVPSGSYLALDREGRVVQTQPDGTS